MSLLAEEERDDLPLVNALREDVRRWRASGWENASETTKKLLRHWWRADRGRRPTPPRPTRKCQSSAESSRRKYDILLEPLFGLTGGFNFQAAWTTGWIAGNALACL